MPWDDSASAPGWPESGAQGLNDNGADNGFDSGAPAGDGVAVYRPADEFRGQDAEVGDPTASSGCRNCGQEGHYARECTAPRKAMGACFNCGEEGHSKAECTAPRKFKGECRNCGQEGHMLSDCPTRVDKCKNCQQEGHVALNCKNPKVIDNTRVADKSEVEAWNLLEQASKDLDITDFKEAVLVLSKAAPDYTYPRLEKEFRKRGFNIYLVAMENDHGDTWTNVNLQGEVGKKYAVSYFTSDKPQRPTLVAKWPASAAENLTRLADAGTPLDRGVDKCNNCGQVGHKSKACPEEKASREQVAITCYLCGEEGHRVRDCTEERKRGGRACKICESEEHLARDCPDREKPTCRNCGDENHMARECPNREKQTCRNCGDEGHFAKECPQPRKQTCRICGEEGHLARDCPKADESGPRPPRDWSKVTCNNCNEVGHGRARCPEAKKAPEESGLGGDENQPNGGHDVGSGWDSGKTNGGSAQAAWEEDSASNQANVQQGIAATAAPPAAW